MRLYFILFLLAGVIVGGCNKHENGSSTVVEKPKNEGKPNHPSVADWEREFEWNKEQILRRHAELALAKLPDYVQDLRGTGGRPKDGDILSDWAFIVPQDRIEDFQVYLRSLGLPAEYMHKDTSFFRRSERDGWAPPDPPAQRLSFLMARTAKASGQLRGLNFVEGRTRIYCFENPNLARSELRIYFDPVTGNTYVMEVYIDPNW